MDIQIMRYDIENIEKLAIDISKVTDFEGFQDGDGFQP